MSEMARGEVPNQAPPTTVTTTSRGAHAVDDVEFADGFASGSNARETIDLSADPFADDLTAELQAAAPKPWHNRATVVLGALVLIVGGFLGGVQVEKHYGKTTTAANARAALSRFANARGGAGGIGGFGRGAGSGGTGTGGGTASAAPSTTSGGTSAQTNTGKITLVDGSTIYVTLASGDVLTVKTTSATNVSVGSVSKVSGLAAGQSVTVTGPTDSSGNVTATSITAGS
ncbi:MAG TPA: hypothetical protein VIR00_08665 [Micromonosporaceae bacterium]